jgi:hypothetical protein
MQKEEGPEPQDRECCARRRRAVGGSTGRSTTSGADAWKKTVARCERKRKRQRRRRKRKGEGAWRLSIARSEEGGGLVTFSTFESELWLGEEGREM